MSWEEEAEGYRVVKSDRGDYSIWRSDREIPAGWRATGCEGSSEECLAHIEGAWRPDYLSAGEQAQQG